MLRNCVKRLFTPTRVNVSPSIARSPKSGVAQHLATGLVASHVVLRLPVAIRAQLVVEGQLLRPLVLHLAAEVESVVVHLEVLLLVDELLVAHDAVRGRGDDHGQVGTELRRLDDVQAHPVGQVLVRLLKQNNVSVVMTTLDFGIVSLDPDFEP